MLQSRLQVRENSSCLRLLGFFFSGRRRHTRLTCDWSSDVCSSDLSRTSSPIGAALFGLEVLLGSFALELFGPRSEERRVGKECRYRWTSNHQKKKKKNANA